MLVCLFNERQKDLLYFSDYLLFLCPQITVLLNTSTASVLQFALGEFLHPDHIYTVKEKHHVDDFLTCLARKIHLSASLVFFQVLKNVQSMLIKHLMSFSSHLVLIAQRRHMFLSLTSVFYDSFLSYVTLLIKP